MDVTPVVTPNGECREGWGGETMAEIEKGPDPGS